MNSRPDRAPDPLAELLHGADVAAPPPPVRAGLADKVRLLGSRRRQRRRITIGSVLALLLIASAIAVLQSSRVRNGREIARAPSPVAPIDVAVQAKWAAEFRRAQAEADAPLAVANRLIAIERQRARLGRLNDALADASPVLVDHAAVVRGEAALTLVGHADRLKTRANAPADALATYRRAVELFPDTPSAAIARRRIEELQSLN